MKTKEITVWVKLNDQGDYIDAWSPKQVVAPFSKAKLIIELPGKKIELTESDYWSAVEEFKKGSGYAVLVNPDTLRDLLFGPGEEA